ncbi:hypothetical protein [Streptomyces sclerotialus]|uniref:hypothetical protein n=1 Tax=Streptomyces sclerotialus TaxID=1957 RepID=UPI000B0415DD
MTRGEGADGGPAEERPAAPSRLPATLWRTVGTALAGIAAVALLLAGCEASGDGVRSEGSAADTPVPSRDRSVTPTPSPSSSVGYKKVDARALLRADPKVGAEVKKTLAKPCTADEYPIDVTYAPLTGGKAPDVIVNVMTCADSVGIGSYVYRKDAKGYENVFSDEQPPVYAGVSKGELQVTRQTYDSDDAVCCPTGEDVLTYRWSKDHFREYVHTYTDYSKTGPDAEATPSED